MCAAWKCYLQVYGLFLLFPLLSEKPLVRLTPLVLNSTSPLLNITHLPHACTLPASPHVWTLALVSGTFTLKVLLDTKCI